MKTELLIEELMPDQANIITESNATSKNMWLSGIFMQSETKNRNGRVYTLQEMTTAVKSANERIKTANGIFGELDHPESLSINLDRISHVITEMKMDGSNVIGKAKLIDTPMGNIAKAIFESGVATGVSSRGTGHVNESGVVEGFSFVTVDIVAVPSAQEAYPLAVMESLEIAANGKEIMSLAESIRHDEAAQKYFQKEIINWLANSAFKKSN
jgi:hypothetical protein